MLSYRSGTTPWPLSLNPPVFTLVCVHDSERQQLYPRSYEQERLSHCPRLHHLGQAPSTADPGALGGPAGSLKLGKQTVSIQSTTAGGTMPHKVTRMHTCRNLAHAPTCL